MNLDFLLEGARPVDLRNVRWPGKLTLLVTAPHPDDFDAIGVTLRYLADQGHELHVLVAETGSGIDKVYGAGMTQAERTRLRVMEQTGSFRYFGLSEGSYRFLALDNAEDDQVADTAGNRQILEKIVRDIRPDIDVYKRQVLDKVTTESSITGIDSVLMHDRAARTVATNLILQ